MMEAKLIKTNRYSQELRFARMKTDTWPGYHESAPLKKRGYWFGNAENHRYLGISPDPGELEHYEVA